MTEGQGVGLDDDAECISAQKPLSEGIPYDLGHSRLVFAVFEQVLDDRRHRLYRESTPDLPTVRCDLWADPEFYVVPSWPQPGSGVELVFMRDQVTESAEVRSTSVTDDEVRCGGALVPELGAAELQPGGPERIKIRIFRYARESVHARGLIGYRERAVIDEPVKVQPGHPQTTSLSSRDHSPLLADHRTDRSQRSTSRHGAIVSIVIRTLNRPEQCYRKGAPPCVGSGLPYGRAMSRDREVLVVGAGVSGLTTAVFLAEAGHPVTSLSAGTGSATTSYAAGATWSPYLVEWTDRAQGWAFHTLDVLRTLAAEPRTGVRLVSGIDAARRPIPPPSWSDHLADFRACAAEELPAGFVAGWRYTAPVVNMPVYLGYLRDRALAAGVTFAEGTVDRLDLAPVVIDCAGVGARELVPDPSLTPVRGQVVIVENPGITEWFVEEGEPPVYFFPYGDTVVLGGTAQTGDANTEPDPAVAALIVARCAAVDPRLTGARVLDHRVGLRPARPLVRLEPERLGDTLVIHNYGHGGAGVTLSWGCAAQVRDAVPA